MSIKLKKEQLGFMEKYALCVDTKMAVHEKFQISCKDNKLTFSQKSNVGYLITELDYISPDQGSVVFDTVTFVSLIKSIPDHTEITITEKGIEFLKNSYDIVNTDMELGDVDEFIKTTTETNEKFNLKDIELFSKIKEYSSGDNLDTVSYQSNYFATSNRSYVTALVKVKDFVLKDDFNFSLDTFMLLTTFKVKEIEIVKTDDFYFFKLDGTFVFIPKKDYILPNMFQDGIKEMYEHPYKFTVLKSSIKETLNRMKIVARNNKEGRIYLEVTPTTLNIKNTDTQFAQEDIKMESVDKEIESIVIPVAVNYLSSVIDKCDGQFITFYCRPDIVDSITGDVDEAVSMKVEDETKNYFYILNLLEK